MSQFLQQYKKLGIDVTIVPIIHPTDQIGGIYISNYLAAMSLNLLKQKQINAIISLGKNCCLSHTKQQIASYLYIPIHDKVTENIKQYFDKCINFIEKCRTKTNILIHCRAGISRSSTIVLAYLIRKYKYSLKDAYTLLKRVHKRAKPNQGFIKQLEEYVKELYGEQQKLELRADSVKDLRTKQWPQNKLKRQKSLHTMANRLKNQGQQIDERITKIKQMIQAHSTRSRTSSDYLRQRLQETRMKSVSDSRKTQSDKPTIITNNKFNPYIKDILSQKLLRNKIQKKLEI